MIALGNLSVKDIETRLGIQLSEDDRDWLTRHRQEPVNIPLARGMWHCYDIPFMIVCDEVDTAEVVKEMFMKHYPFPKNATLQIAWEK